MSPSRKDSKLSFHCHTAAAYRKQGPRCAGDVQPHRKVKLSPSIVLWKSLLVEPMKYRLFYSTLG